MKKLLATLLSLCLLAGTLAACGNGGNEGGTDAPQEASTADNGTGDGEGTSVSDGDVLLQVVWFSDGKEGDTFRRLADRYEEENPGIVVEMIEVPYDELDNRIMNMLAADMPPAIIRQSNIGKFMNQLIDLRDYVEAGDAFEDNFVDGGLPSIFNGRMIGAPSDTTANGLIYNKTAFEAAGVDVPADESEIWTWEEFEEALKKVMADGGVTYGMAYDRTPQRFSTLVYQAGGSLLNADLTQSNFDTEQTRRAVEWFKGLHDQNIIPDSVWLGAEDPNNLFRTGQVATHLGGSWLITNYVDQITDFEWGVTYMPYDAHRSSIPGGKYLAAFDGTGVEKEAALFIEWLSQPEISAEYCQENYFISPVVGNETLDYDFGAEFFAIFNAELAASTDQPGKEWTYQQFVPYIQNDLRDSLAEVLAGSMSVDDYIAEIVEKSEAGLAELAEQA